jgi:hypothetical protein
VIPVEKGRRRDQIARLHSNDIRPRALSDLAHSTRIHFARL